MRSRRACQDSEPGSATVEAAIGLPAFMLFVGLIIFAGRVAIANQAVEAAAAEAARSASISRIHAQAQNTASTAAATSLQNQHVHCVSQQVAVDMSGFSAPVGTPAKITATVSCVVNLSDLSVPGVPGTHTVAATMSSLIDTYRER
jgi:Flp pilus assembly protein TadG